MKTQILCAMRDGSAVIPALRTLEDEQDCTFRMVQSGEGALSAAKKCRPDILVIDAVLPLMDGLGTIDRLREIYGERMPQVIGGVMMPFARDGFLRRGVTCQVRVPWDAQELTEALTQMLKKVRGEADWTRMEPACRRAAALDRYSYPRSVDLMPILLSSPAALAWEDESRMDAVGDMLYKPVALRFGTTEQAVERLIRHAVESVMDAFGVRRVYGFFGNSIDPIRGKPTNAEMIGMLAQYMRVTPED